MIINYVVGSSYEEDGLFTMTPVGGYTVTIPALFLHHTEGTELQTELASNPDMYLYMGFQNVEEGMVCRFLC